MGKEITGAIRPIWKRPAGHRVPRSVDPQKELAIQWDSHNSLTQPRVVENAGVLVTVHYAGVERRVLCTGLTRRGNRYHTLIRTLRRKGVIPAGARVKGLMIDKGFVNVGVNPKKECFLAGDRIVVVVDSKAKTGRIRKVKMPEMHHIECIPSKAGESKIEIISIR